MDNTTALQETEHYLRRRAAPETEWSPGPRFGDYTPTRVISRSR